MKLVGRKTLDAFKTKHAQACGPVNAWIKEIESVEWDTTADLKKLYPKASILANGIVVFDLGGNKYRMETQIVFVSRVVAVRRIGTHAEYDKWE